MERDPELRPEYLRRTSPQAALGIVAGILVGAGLMYLFDLRQGNRRRAIARDKALKFIWRSSSAAGKTYRHLRNRLEGVVAILGRVATPRGAVSDRKLLDRIRSVIGRTVPRPGSVDFVAHDGRVTVTGYMKPHEAGQVIQAIERIPGVKSVDNRIVDSAIQPQTLQ
jgi:hypothetical protein